LLRVLFVLGRTMPVIVAAYARDPEGREAEGEGDRLEGAAGSPECRRLHKSGKGDSTGGSY
jgi:hypothetical protein